MKAPKVVLKNIKTFEGMEGYGLNADIWINGVKCLRVIDEGNGGMFLYRTVYDEKNKTIIETNVNLLESHIKTLPPFKSPIDGMEFPMDMDLFVDQILAEQENKKRQKELKKLQQTALIFGRPNGNSYNYVNFKRPLKDVPPELLKIKFKFIQKNNMGEGDVFLNTNLKELGLL
jgi:hypothetical protein